MKSIACVRVGNGMSDCFPVNVGLCHGSVKCHLAYLIPQILCLNTYMDGVVRGINAGLLGRGLSLLSGDGRE